MLKKIISGLEKLIFNINLTLTKLEGDYNYYNNDYFDLYMKEVNNDINFMRNFFKFTKFEIQQEPYFKILTDKYNKNYSLNL